LLVSKNHPNLLHVDNALLAVIDMQEPFLRSIFERERVVANVSALIQGATVLRVPVVASTQYAERMGGVLPEIQRLLPPLRPPFDKMTFSAFAAPAFASEVQRSGRKQILLCGVESHICVCQTALELNSAGFQVHVVVDAVSSRTDANWKLGIDKMRQAGILISSVESALYELLHAAGTPEFREILKIIK
jgi:nicotinamidase-related amidase